MTTLNPKTIEIYKTKCPYCATWNCYVSGFSVECINDKCQFFNQKHYDYILLRIKQDFETRSTLTPEQIISSGSYITEPKSNDASEEIDGYEPYYYMPTYPMSGFKS